jgi:AbrB family looped-hinge helix DNA binding protein
MGRETPYYCLTLILPKFSLAFERADMEKTKLSNKGQIVIPKHVRTAHGWEPGLEFLVEDTGDGIKLKPLKPYKETTIGEVLGCLNYKGPRKSLQDMEAAIDRGARENS